jgi:hypothetical protein
MENEMIFMLKEREIKKSKTQRVLFISTVISVSVILILNLLSFLF